MVAAEMAAAAAGGVAGDRWRGAAGLAGSRGGGGGWYVVYTEGRGREGGKEKGDCVFAGRVGVATG